MDCALINAVRKGADAGTCGSRRCHGQASSSASGGGLRRYRAENPLGVFSVRFGWGLVWLQSVVTSVSSLWVAGHVAGLIDEDLDMTRVVRCPLSGIY